MSESFQIGDRLLVIFDGHCGFCNRSIRWFLRRDRFDRLRFVASQSPQAAALLGRHQIVDGKYEPGSTSLAPSTIVVAGNPGTPMERILVRSDAVLAMLRVLPPPWRAVARCLSWIPRPARDLVYRLVARCRYRIWGRLETCPIPTAQERSRFL